MLLELDIGNTRSKWRIFGSQQAGVFFNDVFDPAVLDTPGEIVRVRASCVADRSVQLKIAESIRMAYGVEMEVAVTSRYCGGLLNAYLDPSALGVDRWLAALTAWHRTLSACLVIDAGTALTIDYIDNRGVYSGGYILPGLKMMWTCLCEGTGRINVERAINFPDYDPVHVPVNTTQAIQRGAAFAILASVERAAGTFLQKWPSGRIIITGGDGCLISSMLGAPHDYEADLVIDGLQYALP